MARQETANVLINRASLECGLGTSSDPVASTDPTFLQLTGLLTAAGQELLEMHEWQVLRQEYEFTTAVATSATGTYDLPDDFSYMINQTGWDQTNNFPMRGPLSAQMWSYLEGRDFSSSTIYAAFRIAENKLDLYPQPPDDGIAIRFEYISRYWVQQAGEDDPNADSIALGSDVVLYEPILVVKLLKCKFLEAKGFDSRAARMDFETIFNSRCGKDEGAQILNAGRNSRGYPYLDGFRSVGDSGFGS